MDSYLTPPPPLLKKEAPKTMDFYEALREVPKGNEITRLSWTGQLSYATMIDGFLTLFIDGKFSKWLVNNWDMEATDWVIYNPE